MPIDVMLSCMLFLHRPYNFKGIVHRDLKLDNILIASCTRSESGEPLYNIRVSFFFNFQIT